MLEVFGAAGGTGGMPAAARIAVAGGSAVGFDVQVAVVPTATTRIAAIHWGGSSGRIGGCSCGRCCR